MHRESWPSITHGAQLSWQTSITTIEICPLLSQPSVQKVLLSLRRTALPSPPAQPAAPWMHQVVLSEARAGATTLPVHWNANFIITETHTKNFPSSAKVKMAEFRIKFLIASIPFLCITQVTDIPNEDFPQMEMWRWFCIKQSRGQNASSFL